MMTTVALPSRRSPLNGECINKEIRARIAEHVGVDVEYIDDDSDLSDDFGLDLLDLMELLILLEKKFLDGRETDVPEIRVVGDLIRHIEQQHNLR